MTYVDGFLLPVPKKNLKTYEALAKKASKIWMEHGALEYKECVGDDIDAGKWHMVPFDKAAKAKRGEVVVFSFIVYKSRSHRDKVNAKVMADPRLIAMMPKNKKQPFDCKRMCYGGFKTLVQG